MTKTGKPKAGKSKKTKTGRPRIEIDQRKFEKLCEYQCTLEEIAGVMGCSVDTIERWVKKTYSTSKIKATFADIYKKLSAPGKMSLRRAQFRLAEKNASMAIWLGKQYLDQREPGLAQTESDDDVVQQFLDSIKG